MGHGSIRSRRGLLLLCLLAALWLALPAWARAAPMAADATATTGEATSVTASSAELNGVIDPAYADSEWFFEYSRSPDFASGVRVSPAAPAAAGLRAVSALVRGLLPATRYYFRLGVAWQADTTLGPAGRFGEIASLETLRGAARAPAPRAGSFGVVRLSSRSARVSHGAAAVRLDCRGRGRGACRARVWVLLPGARPGSARVDCGSGWLRARAPRATRVTVPLSRECLAALAAAPRRRIVGELVAVFSTRQRALVEPVTLTG